MPQLKVLISREQIAQRVAEMGAEITRDFSGESVIFVGVLKGASIFLSDLARHVDLDATFGKNFQGAGAQGVGDKHSRHRKTSKSSPTAERA